MRITGPPWRSPCEWAPKIGQARSADSNGAPVVPSVGAQLRPASLHLAETTRRSVSGGADSGEKASITLCALHVHVAGAARAL